MADDPSAPTIEQRAEPRHLALVSAQIAAGSGDDSSIALARNISVTGALLLTRRLPEVGEVLELELVLSGDPDPERVTVRGSVVRTERRDLETVETWPFLVAVQFDSSLEQYEEKFQGLVSGSKNAPPAKR